MSDHGAAENDAMRVGCPFCGVSSHEPCWSDMYARERPWPHRARVRFAASERKDAGPDA